MGEDVGPPLLFGEFFDGNFECVVDCERVREEVGEEENEEKYCIRKVSSRDGGVQIVDGS